jgi:hypothetical protein
VVEDGYTTTGRWVRGGILALGGFIALILLVVPARADAGYRYTLSNFSGPVPYTHPRLAADRLHDELYVVFANDIRVFSDTGMEIYRFGADPALELATDLVVLENGDLMVLSRGRPGTPRDRETFLTRCDYRGGPIRTVDRSQWPSPYDRLPLDRVFLREGSLVLVGIDAMQIVEASPDGEFLGAWDLATRLGIAQEDLDSVRIGGIDVSARGDLLVTAPVLFRAFVVPWSGEVRAFGRPGSAPGMFGSISGIAGGDDGRLFVADKLRSVVMVFDSDFRFLEEFGYYGKRRGSLRGPGEIVLGNDDVLFVAQTAEQGVAVFDVGANGGASQ